MKLFYLTTLYCLLILGATHTQAQQTPLFHQYALYPELYNPARIGENGGGRLFFVQRQQWLGIQDAPGSQLFSFSYRLPEGSPLALGLVVKNDRAGLLKRTDAALFSGYHIGNQADRFSVGIYLGFNTAGVAFSEINVPIDPATGLPEDREMKLDAGIGFNYRHQDEKSTLQIGLASHQLPGAFEYARDSASALSFSLVNHLLASVSWKYRVSEQVSIEPIVLFRTLPGAQKLKGGALDLHFRLLLLEERLGFGVGIRPDAGNVFGTVSIALDKEKRSQILAIGDQTRNLGFGYEAAATLGFGEVEGPPGEPNTKEPRPGRPPSVKPEIRTAYWNSTGALSQRLQAAGLATDAEVRSVIGLEGTRFTISFADESPVYHLRQSPEQSRLIRWFATVIRDALSREVTPYVPALDSLTIVLRMSMSQSEMEILFTEQMYAGEWGATITENHMLDEKQHTLEVSGDRLLRVYEFNFLQLYAIRKALAQELQMNESAIRIRQLSDQAIDNEKEIEIAAYLQPTRN